MISGERKNQIIKYIMTLTIIAINILRKPQLLSYPRFYAEEGQSFFAFAHNNTLFKYITSPMYGYYALYNIIATSIANIVPLETAPLITTCLALIVQIATSIFVIWWDIPILNSNVKRFIAAISFPLLCPSQIWLTTIGTQYWLCIITALILLEGSALKVKPLHIVKGIVLIITGLTGILSCMIAPVFLFKWFETKSKQFMLYFCVLSACSLMQLFVFVQACLKHDPGLNNRIATHNSADLLYTATIVFLGSFLTPKETMCLPVINGLDSTKELMLSILGKYGFVGEEVIFLIASIIIIIVIVSLSIKYILNIDYISLIFLSVIVFWVSIKLSINGSGGPRYAFAPSAMLMLFLIASYSKTALSAAHRVILSTVITIIILVHINDYSPSMNRTYSDKWPKWQEEVRLWRIDKNRPLRIWPPPWQVILNNRT